MADPVQEFRLPRGRVSVLATVQGLVSEADAVREAFRRVAPSAMALNVSPEGLVGLRNAREEGPQPIGVEGWGDEGEEYDAADALSDAEIGYGVALEQWGKVRLPPPCLMVALELADEEDVPAFGVDLDDKRYEDIFVDHVGLFSLWRYGRRARKLARRPPMAASAREFAVRWDEALARIGGYGKVERAREAQIADASVRLAERYDRVLVLVDVARAPGVVAELNQRAGGA